MKLSDVYSSRQKHNEGQLTAYLNDKDKVNAIGAEKEKPTKDNNIKLYISREGSYRYVYELDGQKIAVLQIMKLPNIQGKPEGVIANAFTVKEYRRKGYASLLLDYARKNDFKKISHSTDLSNAGKAFAKATG